MSITVNLYYTGAPCRKRQRAFLNQSLPKRKDCFYEESESHSGHRL